MIVKPIYKVIGAASKISKGDFEYRVEVNSRDELGQQRIAFTALQLFLAMLTFILPLWGIHQKLVEESPSPVVTEEQRHRIGSLAANAVKSAGYEGAGTVEFLYSEGEFYFLEVNTTPGMTASTAALMIL